MGHHAAQADLIVAYCILKKRHLSLYLSIFDNFYQLLVKMAHMQITSTPQIEADRRLLQFETYEDYLDSLVTDQDRCYLQNTAAARTVAELGYRLVIFI